MGCDIHIWTEIKSKETGKWEISKQDVFPDDDTKKYQHIVKQKVQVFIY